MRLRFTPRAQRDLADIYDYLAEKNPAAAQRVEDHIRASLELLETWAGFGAPTDLGDVRRLPIVRYPYRAFYRVDEAAGEVQVLRVLHGARIRDLKSLPDEI